MSRLTSFLLAGVAILSGSFVAAPAQASLPIVNLIKGQTKYLEVSLEPGQYLVGILVKGDGAKASFSMYETSGKLIKQSSQLPPKLQHPYSEHLLLEEELEQFFGEQNIEKGAVFGIPRAKAVHFWIRMDACKTLCAAGLITMKAGSIFTIEPPFKVLPARPSYSQSLSPQPTTTLKQSKDEVLVDNPHPSKCNFIEDGKLRDQCSRLKIDKDDSTFSFYFVF